MCHATAQAINRQLPIAATHVWCQGASCGICKGLSGAVPNVLRVLQFPFVSSPYCIFVIVLDCCSDRRISLTPPP